MLKMERQLLLAVTVIMAVVGIFFVFDVGTLESLRRSGGTDQYHLVKRQLLSLGVGLAALGVAAHVSPQFYLKHPYGFYFLAILLLALPLLLGSSAQKGAQRWTSFLGFSVQVGEIAKFCLMVFFAHLVRQTTDWRIFAGYLLLPAVLLFLQKDLGTILIIGAVSAGQYFLAGAPLRDLAVLGVLGLAAVLVMIFGTAYRRERFLTYFHPEENTDSDSYHINQLKIAIGRGGILGQGIGQSRQKSEFIPEVHTDSIFAIVAEETGFIGVCLVLGLYVFFLAVIWRIIQSGQLTDEPLLLAAGIWLYFGSQIFVNLGAISGLTPLTGITLPFLSFGGSSLVVSLFLVGVLASLTQLEPERVITRRKYV